MIKRKKAPIFIFGSLIILTLLMLLPLSRTITAPAILHAQQYQALHTPFPARIQAIHVQNIQNVTAGDLLISLESKDLMQTIEQTKLQLNRAKLLKQRQEASPTLAIYTIEIEQEIKELETKLQGLKNSQKNLQLTAPFDGIVKDVSPSIHTDRWVNSTETLMRIVSPSALSISAYIRADQIERIKTGGSGTFKSDSSFFKTWGATITEIASADTKHIKHKELASLHGGSIPAEQGADGKTQAKSPLYTLKLTVDNKNDGTLNTTQKGIIKLKAKPTSILGNAAKKLTSLFLREING